VPETADNVMPMEGKNENGNLKNRCGFFERDKYRFTPRQTYFFLSLSLNHNKILDAANMRWPNQSKAG
jgi:hypothetical protein